MFTPVSMQRVRILVLKEDQDRVVALLHQSSAVQLEQADRVSFFREAAPPDYSSAVADQAFRFEGLVAALPKVPVSGQMEVSGVDDILEKAKEIHIDDDVRKLKVELESIDLSLNKNRTYLESLARVSEFDQDLSVLSLKSLSVGFYSIPKDEFEDFVSSLREVSKSATVQLLGSTKDDMTVLVILPRESQENARGVFERFKAARLEVPSNLGKPQEARKKLEEENSELESKKRDAENALFEISKKHYAIVLSLREAFGIESQRLEALNRAGQSEKTFVIEGWVPATNLPELESSILSVTKGRSVIEKVDSKETPPTLMRNSPKINYFEFFVRFFSLPQSGEIDPTFTFAIIFPIFFGMMLGDVGYGFVILLIGWWFSRISSGKSHPRWLPLGIRKFGKSLIPRRALGNLGRILIPSAVVAMIVGVLVNAYLGFTLPFYSPVFDLVRSPQVYLVVTLFVGLVHVTLGYIYGIYIALRSGHKKHVYPKIGWIGFMWSAVVAIYVALSAELGHPLSIIIGYAGIAGVIVFGAIVGVFEKTRFVMEIPTLISHVVSYGRILGVLLASVLLGYIASVGLESSLSAPLASIALAFVVFVLVTILNVVTGIFEPSIQGIRLHYVEFYSKFFEGNGKRFQPFAEKRQLTKARSRIILDN